MSEDLDEELRKLRVAVARRKGISESDLQSVYDAEDAWEACRITLKALKSGERTEPGKTESKAASSYGSLLSILGLMVAIFSAWNPGGVIPFGHWVIAVVLAGLVLVRLLRVSI